MAERGRMGTVDIFRSGYRETVQAQLFKVHPGGRFSELYDLRTAYPDEFMHLEIRSIKQGDSFLWPHGAGIAAMDTWTLDERLLMCCISYRLL